MSRVSTVKTTWRSSASPLAESEEPELGADAAKEARPPRKPAVAKILEPVMQGPATPEEDQPGRDRARQKTRQVPSLFGLT